jgi:Uri superfamily endonuclease
VTFGPGGISARVSRHFRKTKSKHWHIDYLRKFITPLSAWYSYDPIRHEHRWAQAMEKIAGLTAITRLGCSDCRCLTHLFHSVNEPDFNEFTHAVGGKIELWLYKTSI